MEDNHDILTYKRLSLDDPISLFNRVKDRKDLQKQYVFLP